jgi:hypothetical protein
MFSLSTERLYVPCAVEEEDFGLLRYKKLEKLGEGTYGKRRIVADSN